MRFLNSLFRPLRPQPPLRSQVEDAVARDDVSDLIAALQHRRDEGKRLIREYERELAAAPTGHARDSLIRRVTALVAVYAKAFEDDEPLGWFRREGEEPERDLAAVRLQDAKRLVAEGQYEEAVARAASGLELLAERASSGVAYDAALASALLGVQGGARLRGGDLAAAEKLFRDSLDRARLSRDHAYLGAALLNFIDLCTHRGSFAEADEILEEAAVIAAAEIPTAAPDTPAAPATPAADTRYGDVFAKVAIERGLALTRAGDLERAVAAFDHAARVRPEWPFPYYQRAWARLLAGDSGGALDDYRDCARRAPVFFTVQREIRCLESVAAGSLPIDVYRSFCAVRDGARTDPEATDEAAGHLIERAPGFAPAYVLRAEARLARGDGEGARAAAEAALLRDPDEDTAAAALFVQWSVARGRGDQKAAAQASERLETAYPEQPTAVLLRRLREAPGRDHAFRWTFAFDGTLRFEEVEPPTPRPDRSSPPPGSRA